MELSTVTGVAAAVLLALGGGGGIVLALSSWLGKIWADRLMTRETARHARDLEEFRSALAQKNDENLESLRSRLSVDASSHLREVQDKVAIYRAAADMIAEMLSGFDRASLGHPIGTDEMQFMVNKFNRDRMRIYGYLAMLAPQAVMDCYDELVDHLFGVLGGHVPYEWTAVRTRVLAMINAIRRDIGLNKDPIEYRGKL